MPADRKVLAPEAEPRLRRAYFECRYGQLHVHHAIPPGGGFDERTTLICIHDREVNARSLLPLLAAFGRSRSVYAPDLPGVGESDVPPAAEAAAAAVAALADFIADMRLRQVDLLGVGAGTAVARELASQRGPAVRRVVLLGGQAAVAAATPALAQPLLELAEADPAALARDVRLSEFLQ